MQRDVENWTVLQRAAKAGYADYVEHKNEMAFQTKFIDHVNQEGGGQITAVATGADEPRTGADVIISWSTGTPQDPQKFHVYLQIKILFESKAKYLAVADAGSGNAYASLAEPWEYPYFDAQYRSTAKDYDGEFQLERLYKTIKEVNKDKTVAAAGFLLVGGPSQVSVIPLSVFLAELSGSYPGKVLAKQLEEMKDTMVQRFMEKSISVVDILKLPQEENIW